MFGSEILEVAIGVVFVFLLVSIIASAIREGLEGLMHTRAAYLERGIRELLHDRHADVDGLARVFYTHPLISSMYSSDYKPGKTSEIIPIFVTGRSLPSYIPANNFALALMDIAVRGPLTDAVSGDAESPPFTLETMRQNISQLGNPAVQRVLLTAIDSAQGDLQKAQLSVQAWFDSGMDRVSGWYKRATSWILFWIGMGVAVLLNVDSIAVAYKLYHDDAQRTVIVAAAERASMDSNYLNSSYEKAKADLLKLGLPIGWPQKMDTTAATATTPQIITPQAWYKRIGVQTIIGWLITALAATFGAPFWFDLLNKIMVIRSTVKPHEKSPEESSEDRQKPAAKTVVTVQSDADSASSAGGLAPIPPLPPPLHSSNMLASPGRLRDVHSGIDACDVEMDPDKGHAGNTMTHDEDLPEAKGGVA